MSNLSVHAILTLVAALGLCALCAPTHDQGNKIKVELSAVLDRSVCPIKVVIDEDPNRIPRRIKMLKCANTPNPLCQNINMTHACCHHHHHNFTTECVEVTDNVLVSFRDKKTPMAIPVSVGCTCMIREGASAVTVSP